MIKKYFIKRFLIIFLLVLMPAFVLTMYSNNNSHKIKVTRNTYNMNVFETMKLDKYDDDTSWKVSNDNIEINNNTLIAKKIGKSTLTGKIKGKKAYDLKINILDDKNIYVDKHNINLKLKQNKQIKVKNNKNNNLE